MRQINWSDLIPAGDWRIQKPVLERAREAGVRSALGGGLAFSVYSGRLRNTKDLDLYVLPRDRDRMIDVVRSAGFADYYDQSPYDRSWIFRACRDRVVVDIIWRMANHRAEVDECWLRGPLRCVLGEPVRVLPVEELIWSKVYVMQRERCDWPDLLNVIDAQAHRIDWEYLIDRLGTDSSLMGAVLCLYGWLRPDQAARIPGSAWRAAYARSSGIGSDPTDRPRLLDSRDWFGANPPPP